MRNDTWAEMWTQLESYFQRPEETQAVVDTRAKLYRDHLDVLTDSQWRMAIREIIETQPRHHFPSIAQIRDAAGLAPETVRKARADDYVQASDEYRRAYEAKYGKQRYVDEQDLKRGVRGEDLYPDLQRKAGPQETLLESIALDYPIVPGLSLLDQAERIAVLGGLMQPVRLIGWTVAEIKAGKREPAPPAPEPVATQVLGPETFRESEAAERRAEEQARADLVNNTDPPAMPHAASRASHPQPKPEPPAFTPPEEEFF